MVLTEEEMLAVIMMMVLVEMVVVVVIVMMMMMMILCPWPYAKHFPYIITLNLFFQAPSVSLNPSTSSTSPATIPAQVAIVFPLDLLTLHLVANLVYTISSHYISQRDHLELSQIIA